MTIHVGYFVGSLSSTSINRVLSRALIRLVPEDMQFTELPIGNLPLYSPDYDSDFPAEARAALGENSFDHIPAAVIGAST